MKRLLLALVPVVFLAGTASAESGPRWDGFYGGVHVGAGWLSGDMQAYTPYNSFQGFRVSGLNASKVLGGAQIGFNHQLGSFVIGAEAGASITDIKRSSTHDAPGTLFWRKNSFSASVAPRVGYATDRFMFYGKGGLAIANFKVGHDQNGIDISDSKTKVGYVLGGGIEYALTSRVSAGVEYNYMEFGNGKQHVHSPNTDIYINQGGHLDAVKFVLNYKF